jgi:predicted SAM-dependent methyltransferase
MADVLEHMPFPQEGLAATRRLLRPGGILFVSMPNYDCAAWRLLDVNNSNFYWGELEHFHNFSRRRLYALLSDMGFEALHSGISKRYRVCMEVIARTAN